jgi:hypothetical protein
MRHRVIGRLLALFAAFTLAGATAHAGAEVLSLSNQSFRVAWTALAFEGGFGTVRCPVTVEGSFHSRTLAKVAGSLFGYITRATSGTCSQGGMTVLRETLPWHVQYTSFSGTLPNITAVNLSVVGAAFSIREPVFGITCLGRTAAERPMTLGVSREAAGSLTTASAGGSVGTSCGLNGTLSGSGNVTLLGSTTRISLTLVEGVGDLSITPDPIDLTADEIREVVLTNPGTGSTKINSIGPEELIRTDFRVEDRNGCGGFTIFPNRIPRDCRFILRRLNAGRSGQLLIRYRARFAEIERTKSVTVRS